MRAMIFAAGLGTRLKPLTDTMPKALVPIGGKPLLQWQIENLLRVGIDDITINVHHFPDQIIDFIQAHNYFGAHIQISDERDMLLDTGGGLRRAWDTAEPILALNVDILSNIDIPVLLHSFEQQPEAAGLLVVSPRATQRYLCFDPGHRLVGWTNISTGEVRLSDGEHLAFSGMQILRPTMQQYLHAIKADKFSLIDLYLSACQQVKLQAFVPQDYRMMDVGKIDHLDEANRFAASLS